VQAPLGQPDRDRGGGAQLGDQLPRRGVELRLRHRPVDHAPGGGVGPAHRAAEEQELLGARDADQPRHQPGRAAVGREAAPGERQPEAAVLGRDREVGGQGELATQPGRPAAHGADDRELDLQQQRHQAVRLQRGAALDAAGAGLLAACDVAGHPVGPGAEVIPGAGEQDGPERVVVRCRLQGVDDLSHGRRVERVLAGGPVEDDAQDAAVGVHGDTLGPGLRGHCRSPAGPATGANSIGIPHG
jgi:hypothetical protein